jgi:hypothetical protein
MCMHHHRDIPRRDRNWQVRKGTLAYTTAVPANAFGVYLLLNVVDQDTIKPSGLIIGVVKRANSRRNGYRK